MATTKKKYNEDDFTNQAQAMNKEDVDAQDSRTRLWQSLNSTYGKQRDELAKNYGKAISQQDNAMLARGMQRSSYGAQVRSGLMNDSIKAQDDNYAAQIADYQSRVGQLEQQEKEDERWERQYADSRADTAWNQQFQQNQFDLQKQQYADQRDDAAWNRGFQTQQFDLQKQQYSDSRADTAWNQAFQQQQYSDSRADTAWNQAFQQSQFDYNKQQNAEQMAYQREQNAWNQAFQQSQFDYNKEQNAENMAYQRERDAVNDAFQQQQYSDSRSDTAWNQGFQQGQFDYQKDQAAQQMAYQQSRDAIEDAFRNKQFETQVDQWKQEFNYNQKTNEQKIAFDILMAAVAADKDADDATLARAGISRAEYNSMRKAKSSGGGGRKKTTEEEEQQTGAEGGDAGFLGDLDKFRTGLLAGTGGTGLTGKSTTTSTSALRGDDSYTVKGSNGQTSKDIRKLINTNGPTARTK